MTQQDKNKKVLYITHQGELLIWLIVILIITAAAFLFNIHTKNNNNEYNIFMPDIDGLIVGSPVRTMGIEVGHVTKIKPTNEEIYVKFVLHDKTTKLPQGTKATVEFSGMAGSKSLELYLPNEKSYIDSTVPMLSVESPKRLHDAFGLLNEMFKTIGDMIYRSSHFTRKVSEIEFPESNGNIKDAKEFLNYTNEIIDIQQQRVDNLGKALDERKK